MLDDYDRPSARRAALQMVWSICASMFVFFTLQTLQTPRTGLHLATGCLFISFTMAWLVLKALRLLRGIVSVPGPVLAKLTVLWKLRHIRRGTYDATIRYLHANEGDLVQVGPYEYSIGNPAYFERCAKLRKVSPLPLLPGRSISSEAFHLLEEALKMANVYHYETAIEACNQKLLETLAQYADTGEAVKMSNIIACYAYDVLYATTTGQQSTFLDRPMDAQNITSAMESWKFWAVLNGSYMRFHPLIRQVIRLCNPSNKAEREVKNHLDIGDKTEERSAAAEMLRTPSDDPDKVKHVTEACIAMVLAGSDPVITHILSSLFYIYRDPQLLRRLREEIKQSRIWQPPRMKHLMRIKSRMPLLHAVLQESLRLHQPQTTGFGYLAPEGGVMIGEKHVPEGCTICLEPSVAHVNPDVFGADAADWYPDRWLRDSETVEMKRHMLAFHHIQTQVLNKSPNQDNNHHSDHRIPDTQQFGASTTTCPGADLHIAVTCKLLTEFIPIIDLEMFTNTIYVCPSGLTIDQIAEAFVASVSSSTINAHRGITRKDEMEVSRLIGRNCTKALLDQYNPSREVVAGKLLFTKPMNEPSARQAFQDIIDRVWQKRLRTRVAKNNRVHITVARMAEPVEQNAGWQSFATSEKTKSDETDKIEQAKARDAEAFKNKTETQQQHFHDTQNARAAVPQASLTQTFKLTTAKAANGKLGGSRKFAQVVKSEHAADGTITEVVEEVNAAQIDEELTAKAKRNALPPHLRKK